MPRRLALIVLLAVFALTPQASSAADWMRLRTANFTVEGDVGETELRAVARRLEQFRETIGRTFSSAKLVTPTPVTVLVFSHASDFKAIALLFAGKPIELAGYATSSPIGSSIAICAERRDQAYQVAYHEFGHLLISNAMWGLPVWLQEGLAEFYGTFELSEDGRKAVLGKPVAQEEFALLREELLPMSELLAATHDSKLYNVSSDRNLFYAQSWAFVHYLLLGNPERGRQFAAFLQRLGMGVPVATAYTDSFPNAEKLESELTAYVRQFSIHAVGVTLAGRVGGGTDSTLTRMTRAETIAALGLELAKQKRYAEAQARFEQALKLAPGTASAHTGLGVVYTMQGQIADALRELRKGVELADEDAQAHFAFGYAALQCQSSDCLGEQGSRETARREFQRAVDLQPQFPEALSLLGWTELATGGDLASAERHLLQAITFLPGREDYRLNLAQIYLRQENVAKVQEMLGPIAAMSADADNKSKARQMLGSLAEIRARREAERAAGEARAADLSARPTPPAGATAPAGADTQPEAKATPIFRTIGAGERRLEVVLETILCPAAGAVVVAHNETGVHRFWAPALTAIDFITYRDDLKGSVACGPVPAGTRVFVTSRNRTKGEGPAAAWIEGRVVAIEYLPKGK